MPDQRHLYLLVAGVVLGVLLSPAIFGRLAPTTYTNLFLGGSDLAEQRAAHQRETDTQLFALQAAGAPPEEIFAYTTDREQTAAFLTAQLTAVENEKLMTLMSYQIVLVLTVVIVMAAESSVTSPSLRTRFVTTRYVLITLWIIALFIRPDVFAQLPLVFGGILVAAIALVALFPKRKPQ